MAIKRQAGDTVIMTAALTDTDGDTIAAADITTAWFSLTQSGVEVFSITGFGDTLYKQGETIVVRLDADTTTSLSGSYGMWLKCKTSENYVYTIIENDSLIIKTNSPLTSTY